MPPRNNNKPAQTDKRLDEEVDLAQFGLGLPEDPQEEADAPAPTPKAADLDVKSLSAVNQQLRAKLAALEEHSNKQAQAIAIMHSTLRTIMSRQQTGWTVLPEDLREQIVKAVKFTEAAFAKKKK